MGMGRAADQGPTGSSPERGVGRTVWTPGVTCKCHPEQPTDPSETGVDRGSAPPQGAEQPPQSPLSPSGQHERAEGVRFKLILLKLNNVNTSELLVYDCT